MKKHTIYVIIGVLTFLISCSKDENYEEIITVNELSSAELNLPTNHFNYANIEFPNYYINNNFPQQMRFQKAAIEFDNTPLDNPITDAGATLGRVLFYDKKLSNNSTISCASCHQQENGFSDKNVLSVGFEGGHTRRHSMGLANARFYSTGKFFWDERANSLEDQVLMPFQDDVEMGLTLEQLVNIVQEQQYYPTLFRDAFGDESINSDRISKALAQFIRSIVSITSRYDIARTEVDSPLDDFPSFTDEENIGKHLFFNPIRAINGGSINCSGCHASEAFVSQANTNGVLGSTLSSNNGLDGSSLNDFGVNETTNNPNDIGKFKAPSLKNIGVRPPYMHDGRFSTLEAVIEHYNSGIQAHSNLATSLIGSDGNPVRLGLTEDQKNSLVAFLHTLSDNQMLNDEKYSNPFIE